MEERAVYSCEEAAAKLGVNIKTLYEGVKEGSIPSMRVGRRILIPRAAFDRLLEQPTGGPKATA